MRDRAGARAHGRRPPEHPRARHAPVPPARAPGRPPLPGGRRSSSSTTSTRRPTTEAAARRARALRRARRAGHRPRARRRTSSPSWTPTGWRRTVEFELDAKQELLELRSENARLRLLATLLRGRDRAPGAARARPGARPLQRQGALRLARLLAAGGRPAGRSAARTAQLVQHRRLAAASCRLKRDAAVFVAHAVAEHRPGPPARATGVRRPGPCRSSWIARASTSCGSLELARRVPPLHVHAAFFVDEQRQPRVRAAAAAL